MGLSEDRVADLKVKYGKVFELTVGAKEDARTIVVRKPNRLEWKRFKQQARDEAKQEDAGLNLVKTVLLHPSAEELDVWIEEFPGLEDSFGVGIVDLINLKEKVEKKAL